MQALVLSDLYEADYLGLSGSVVSSGLGMRGELKPDDGSIAVITDFAKE
ncbi:hypothetical protein [Pseudobacteriovorax antillogorgiicola]|nr:hypothetical protein [Pseudobacteriovorax antillogorgiicola]